MRMCAYHQQVWLEECGKTTQEVKVRCQWSMSIFKKDNRKSSPCSWPSTKMCSGTLLVKWQWHSMMLMWMKSRPVKQAPDCVNLHCAEITDKEMNYMLEHRLTEPVHSEWCSPVTIMPKPSGLYWFCIACQKVNSLTKKDSYQLARVEECTNTVGNAKFY